MISNDKEYKLKYWYKKVIERLEMNKHSHVECTTISVLLIMAVEFSITVKAKSKRLASIMYKTDVFSGHVLLITGSMSVDKLTVLITDIRAGNHRYQPV